MDGWGDEFSISIEIKAHLFKKHQISNNFIFKKKSFYLRCKDFFLFIWFWLSIIRAPIIILIRTSWTKAVTSALFEFSEFTEFELCCCLPLTLFNGLSWRFGVWLKTSIFSIGTLDPTNFLYHVKKSGFIRLNKEIASPLSSSSCSSNTVNVIFRNIRQFKINDMR
jgi:hypothetical protein